MLARQRGILRMKRFIARLALMVFASTGLVALQPATAFACPVLQHCPDVNLDGGASNVSLDGEIARSLAGPGVTVADYRWRLRNLCVIHDEIAEACSASDFRPCPVEPGRVIQFFVLERQPL